MRLTGADSGFKGASTFEKILCLFENRVKARVHHRGGAEEHDEHLWGEDLHYER